MVKPEEFLQEIDKKRSHEIDSKRKQFIKDFPIEDIEDLTLDDYLIAKDGFGNQNSFCRRISYGLNDLASVGNMYFHAFGIFLNNGTEITLSDTFKKNYGADYQAAFKFIKSLIVRLLTEFLNGNFTYVDKCELNRFFKQRLLIVYYGDILVPVTAMKTMDGYCDALDINYDKDDTMIYKNFSLFTYKNSDPELEKWNNFDFMMFCDRLWRDGNIYDTYASEINSLSKQEKINTIIQYMKQNKEEFGFTEEKKTREELSKLSEIENSIEDIKQIDKTEKESIVKNRIGQSWFRDRLLRKYERCMICGITNNKLLRASHIKDWSLSNNEERLDINNGLLLCTQHDALFDRNLITFDKEGKIIISKSLSEEDRKIIDIRDGITINLNEKMSYYMNQHNKTIFKNSDVVYHSIFGVGTIINQDLEYVFVRFNEGEKTFLKDAFEKGILKHEF